jgi:hypothetical protein
MTQEAISATMWSVLAEQDRARPSKKEKSKTMAYIGGTVAATTAAVQQEKRRKLMEAEEENMTDYTHEDLAGDWEFKIVRSDTGAFRRPEVLSELVEQEAQAGWIMLEKFDDNRVRFKRPRSAQARDPFLPDGVDPYRTRYGSFFTRRAALVTLMMGLLFLVGFGFLVMLLAAR